MSTEEYRLIPAIRQTPQLTSRGSQVRNLHRPPRSPRGLVRVGGCGPHGPRAASAHGVFRLVLGTLQTLHAMSATPTTTSRLLFPAPSEPGPVPTPPGPARVARMGIVSPRRWLSGVHPRWLWELTTENAALSPPAPSRRAPLRLARLRRPSPASVLGNRARRTAGRRAANRGRVRAREEGRAAART
jgi:hypothetical protein